MQDHVYQVPVQDMADPRQRLIDTACRKALRRVLVMNGVTDFKPVNEGFSANWSNSIFLSVYKVITMQLNCFPKVV